MKCLLCWSCSWRGGEGTGVVAGWEVLEDEVPRQRRVPLLVLHKSNNVLDDIILTSQSGQLNTGSTSANKQCAWDEMYVDIGKTNSLFDCTTDLDKDTKSLDLDMHARQHSINTIGYTCYRCPAAASFSSTKLFESRLLCALVPLYVSSSWLSMCLDNNGKRPDGASLLIDGREVIKCVTWNVTTLGTNYYMIANFWY